VRERREWLELWGCVCAWVKVRRRRRRKKMRWSMVGTVRAESGQQGIEKDGQQGWLKGLGGRCAVQATVEEVARDI